MIKAVFFDLDGTLLPMDEKKFTEIYLKELAFKMMPYGYDPNTLPKSIFIGLKAMIHNDGSKTNQDAFFDVFDLIYQKDTRKDIDVFNSFYGNEFKKAKAGCGENPLAKGIISSCKKKLPYVILSTNPIFPRVAQQSRLSFIGLKDSDFTYVTDYSNSSYCKPNPQYFQVLLDRFQLKPEEVILFGNDTLEDGDCASSLGIKVYLLKRCLIRNEKSKGNYPLLDMEDVLPTLEREIENS